MKRMVGCFCLMAISCLAGCKTPILFVASNDGNEAWTSRAVRSFERSLLASPQTDARVELCELNLRLRSKLRQTSARIVRTRTLHSSAEYVVCLGEPAIREVADALKTLPKTFIVAGLRANPAEYGFTRSKNVYGVRTPPDLRGAMELVLKVKPSARRLAVLTDTGPASWAVRLKLKSGAKWPMEVVAVEVVNTLQAWKEAVSSLQNRADAILVASMNDVKDEFGEVASMAEVARATGAASRIPTVGLRREAVTCGGLLLAVGPSAQEVGKLAAEQTLKVMYTWPAHAVRPRFVTATRSVRYVNAALARKLGIKLPLDVTRSAAPGKQAPPKSVKKAPPKGGKKTPKPKAADKKTTKQAKQETPKNPPK